MNIFHIDVSRDNCRVPLLRDTSRDDCRLSIRRDASRDNRNNLLRRDVYRDDCRSLHHRGVSIDDSRCTAVEMPSYRCCRISSCKDTYRDICRYEILITASCRQCRNKPCRRVLVLVNSVGDTLIELLDPTISRI